MTRNLLLGLLTTSVVFCAPTFAADNVMAPKQQGQAVVSKAVKFLLGQQQPDGSWAGAGRVPPAVTAMAVKVIAQDPTHGPTTEAIKPAVESL